MKCLTLIALAILLSLPARSQEMITEPSTGRNFPAEVTFKQGEVTYALAPTGMAVRKKVIFKVYGMVHYMQNPAHASRKDAFAAILQDGKAKQITMEFVRDVEFEKIQDAYRDGFKSNAGDDYKKIEPLVNQFVGYFIKDVKDKDVFIIRWIPGGTIETSVQGNEKPAITDPVFARTLWSIWFGEDSIVDRDDLVQLISQ